MIGSWNGAKSKDLKDNSFTQATVTVDKQRWEGSRTNTNSELGTCL
jgi:hypothetical protein